MDIRCIDRETLSPNKQLYINRWTDGKMDRYTRGQTERFINALIDKQTYGRKDSQVVRTNGHID